MIPWSSLDKNISQVKKKKKKEEAENGGELEGEERKRKENEMIIITSNSSICIECSQIDCLSRSWNAAIELILVSLTYLQPPPQTKSGLFNQMDSFILPALKGNRTGSPFSKIRFP